MEYGILSNKPAGTSGLQDGYGPGRPGKPGQAGKDGKAGTAGKKGKKGANGTTGSRALNVFLSLSGEGLESVAVTGHSERVVNPPNGAQKDLNENDSALADQTKSAASEPILEREPLAIIHRLNTYPNQRPLPELDDLDNLNR